MAADDNLKTVKENIGGLCQKRGVLGLLQGSLLGTAMIGLFDSLPFVMGSKHNQILGTVSLMLQDFAGNPKPQSLQAFPGVVFKPYNSNPKPLAKDELLFFAGCKHGSFPR